MKTIASNPAKPIPPLLLELFDISYLLSIVVWKNKAYSFKLHDLCLQPILIFQP